MKPLHAAWVVNFYNYITLTKGKEVVLDRRKATGIYKALHLDAVCHLDQEELDLYCTQKGEHGNKKVFLETHSTCLMILMITSQL